MPLIQDWLPPSRANWSLMVELFAWFPTVSTRACKSRASCPCILSSSILMPDLCLLFPRLLCDFYPRAPC